MFENVILFKRKIRPNTLKYARINAKIRSNTFQYENVPNTRIGVFVVGEITISTVFSKINQNPQTPS